MMTERELKGMQIAAQKKLTFVNGVWTVPSQSGNGKYQVLLDAGNENCTCDDFIVRKRVCKHIVAARIVYAREGGPPVAIDASAPPKKPTYRQDWPAYNQAQMTEKPRFLELLSDLCWGIQEPVVPPTGRRPHSVRDALFAMALKVYTTFSCRRLQGDLDYAHSHGYLSRRIPGMKVAAFFENLALTERLETLISLSALPLRGVETTFAPDSSGFSSSRHVRWFNEKYGEEQSGRDWVKAHILCGVKTNIVTKVVIGDRNAADSPQFPLLLEDTAENFTVKEVVADKAYLSNDNLDQVDDLGGKAFIPFKVNSGPGERGSTWERMYHYYQLHREEFLRHYHQRSNAESTFSMVKAKFRDEVRSRTETAMKNEVLCKFLCHNICVVHQSQIELGIEADFWPESGSEGPATLSFARPS